MAHYSLSTFLRQTPHPLLTDYFAHRGIPVDLPHRRRDRVPALLESLDHLDDDVRAQVDGDFQEIHTLADRWGTRLLLEQAGALGIPLADTLGAARTHHERAMWLFLHREHAGLDLFEHCLALARLQDLRFTQSRRRKGLPRVRPRHDAETLEGMAEAIRAYYRSQGRGRRCVVEHARRLDPERHCFLAWPEDYGTSDLQYQGDQLRRRLRRSVFDVAFIFRPDEGVLDVAAPGAPKEARVLHEVFCRYALDMDGLPADDGERCWDLNGLKRPGFAFPTDPEDGIAEVQVLALRLHLAGRPRQRLQVEVDPSGGQTLAQWLEHVVDQQHVPLRMLDVSQARLRVVFRPEGARPPRTVTFTLTAPNSHNLKDDPAHLVVKRYLARWSLDG